ncbi:MAG: hypothetical protein R3B53_03875 [Candidatus Paceibacterota bacterium]
MKNKKLSLRERRVLKAFPSDGCHSVDDLVKIYNNLYGMPRLIQVLGVSRLLKLPMTPKRLRRILACLMVRQLVKEEVVFEEGLYTLTRDGEQSK